MCKNLPQVPFEAAIWEQTYGRLILKFGEQKTVALPSTLLAKARGNATVCHDHCQWSIGEVIPLAWYTSSSTH
jgi:hypothetical protein